MSGREYGRGGPSVPQYSFGSAARRCVCAPRRARRAAGRFRVPYLLRGLLSWWVVSCPGPVLRLPSVACVPAWASCVPLRSAVLCGALRGFGCSAVLCGALRCSAVLCVASSALRCSVVLCGALRCCAGLRVLCGALRCLRYAAQPIIMGKGSFGCPPSARVCGACS